VRALAAQHERRAGTSADPATVRVLVDRFVEEEILYQEALRRGLISDLDRDPKWHGDAMEILRGLGRAYA